MYISSPSDEKIKENQCGGWLLHNCIFNSINCVFLVSNVKTEIRREVSFFSCPFTSYFICRGLLLLVKRDRGRPIHPKARPKAFGEVHVPKNIAGSELLEQNDGNSDEDTDSDVMMLMIIKKRSLVDKGDVIGKNNGESAEDDDEY